MTLLEAVQTYARNIGGADLDGDIFLTTKGDKCYINFKAIYTEGLRTGMELAKERNKEVAKND